MSNSKDRPTAKHKALAKDGDQERLTFRSGTIVINKVDSRRTGSQGGSPNSRSTSDNSRMKDKHVNSSEPEAWTKEKERFSWRARQLSNERAERMRGLSKPDTGSLRKRSGRESHLAGNNQLYESRVGHHKLLQNTLTLENEGYRRGRIEGNTTDRCGQTRVVPLYETSKKATNTQRCGERDLATIDLTHATHLDEYVRLHRCQPKKASDASSHPNNQLSSSQPLQNEITLPAQAQNKTPPLRAQSDLAARQSMYDTLTYQEQREQDKWAMTEIKRSGVCPQGYHWKRTTYGYRCEAGAHSITDEELAEGLTFEDCKLDGSSD